MKRLSNEEIDEIAVKYLNYKHKANDGSEEDLKRFHAYQNIAAHKLKFLVINRVSKYRKFSNYIDLEQDGFEALMLAFNTYDPKKGSFGWWANKYIATRVSRAANAHSTIRFPMKKAREMKPYKTSVFPLMIDEHSPVDAVEAGKNVVNISEAINKLSENHQKIINMTYGLNNFEECSINGVMKELSISRQQYSKLLNEAQDKIKKHLGI